MTAADWTPAELAELERGAPEFTGRAPDGALYATITKTEAARLFARYPSCFPNDPPLTGSAAEDALRARFPSMFKKGR